MHASDYRDEDPMLQRADCVEGVAAVVDYIGQLAIGSILWAELLYSDQYASRGSNEDAEEEVGSSRCEATWKRRASPFGHAPQTLVHLRACKSIRVYMIVMMESNARR